MDPNAAWIAIRECIEAGMPQDALNHAIDLGGWLNGGGFMPDCYMDGKPQGMSTPKYVWAILSFIMDAIPSAEDGRLELQR